jgi:hypothetical protein
VYVRGRQPVELIAGSIPKAYGFGHCTIAIIVTEVRDRIKDGSHEVDRERGSDLVSNTRMRGGGGRIVAYRRRSRKKSSVDNTS